MRKAIRVITGLWLCIVAAVCGHAAEATWEYSVQVSASVQASPAQITLTWPQDTALTPNSYTIYRKSVGATSWGSGTTLPGSATSYTDSNVSSGSAYEYQIVKSTSQYNGYGYIYAGINAPLTENRGKLLLVVDNTYAANLATELTRLQQDLVGDGWTVTRLDVSRSDSVTSVKNQIKAQYNADPTNVKAVFLFGHVPVPYSGDIVPDGHVPDHQGAWACDGYYADMDGTWTDSSVNDTSASDARTRNAPGDGKFDPSTFPAPLKLMVGRVDLANMPGRLVYGGPATFPSELELLRNYLNKDHNYRMAQFNIPRRAIVGDYIGIRGGEAFAASGWRSFAPMFGANNVASLPTPGTWISRLSTTPYLWAYGCGGGTYSSIGGIGNAAAYNTGTTIEMMQNDPKIAFALLFGSWLGDWDSEDNIMRCILALPTYGLAAGWSGRPHWFAHHMALGETIGYSTRVTQNNGSSGLYQNQLNYHAGEVHVALMGDPTLRLFPVAPATGLRASPTASSTTLNWNASTDSAVAGYYVYRASNPNGPFTRLTSSLVTGASFTDTTASATPTYMVRAVKLETSGSGTYYNPSQGAFVSTAGSGGSTDTTPPTVSMTAPAAGATVSGTAVTVSANASDNVGVAGVQFKLDGSNLGAESTSAPYSTVWNSTSTANGSHVLTAVARDAAGNQTSASSVTLTVNNSSGSSTNTNSNTTISVTNNTAWVNDSLPAGAIPGSEGGDSWSWVSSNPTPYYGATANQSSINAGSHQHYFYSATSTLAVNTAESLFAYVYIDPANVPSEIMLQWNDGSWEHRAFWGSDRISYGTPGTPGHYYMGPLPATGRWVRLEVPASQVALEGKTLNGMAFSQFDGRATWDYAGKSSVTTTNSGSGNSGGTGGSGGGTNSNTGTNTSPTTVTNNVSWVNDALPTGAIPGSDGGDSWNWVSSNPTPYYGATANQSSVNAGSHQHYFYSATSTLSINPGDSLYAYVYLDPANLPSQIMLQWNDGSWEHRAYWGANKIQYGTDGTTGRRYMGPLPAAGQWVRLQVPANQVALEGSTLNGMAFSQFDGRATWDYAGKSFITTTNTNSSGGGTGGNGSGSGGGSGGGTNTNTGSGGSTNVTSSSAWVDDSLPTGAVAASDGGDSWNWVGSNPTPFWGALANQSTLSAGLHQHYFASAQNTMAVNSGDTMIAYVYLDPANVPSQIMLQWNDGSWEHRAYWGQNRIQYGTDGTPGRRYMGALPTAGQWARLEVPASQVGLEGSTISGMAFSLFDGRATWDYAGKSSSGGSGSGNGSGLGGGGSFTNPPPATNSLPQLTTNGIPGINQADYVTLGLPQVSDNGLKVLTPTLLELKLINTQPSSSSPVSAWNLVDSGGNFATPPANAFTVTANGQTIAVTAVGFKRRPIYAPFEMYDLRIENCLYLQLGSAIGANQTVEVKNPSAALWNSTMRFATATDPLRYNPAIHVNQEGYLPAYTKKAMVGYYAGNLGEVSIPTSGGFQIVDANTGASVYSGNLTVRADVGYTYTPTPYQKVYEADFTGFTTPGQYRLMVPGMGASLPFLIDNGVAMDFARAYALGLYHQRCGTNTAMPFTRFNHDPCHTAAASVPWPSSNYSFTWNTIAGYGANFNSDNPVQTAPAMTSSSLLYPYVRQGTLDTSGGHHDAGDYSKYTINSASFIHYLMFSVDSLPGVSDLDNLGIPESGDGIPDVLQEAKWEADFLAKLQDTDGGFYFLVYPVNREYEAWVTPDHGDPQVVWPKTTSVTAASVAALAQCASSPAFKRAYPATAATYLAKAKLGWQFLMNAISKYGKNGAYQKITHYGDNFADQDELAWAACEMYLATGDQSIHQQLLSWFDPADPATRRWGWWHLTECYGHAIRSYAFAARNGRVAASGLDATFLSKCQTEIAAAGDDVMNWSRMSAYGSSFPDATKRVMAAGWYFSTDQAFDVAVAYQLNPKADYITALLANMNYEGGCNPVNTAYITGMGWRRQRDIVSQWHSVTPTNLPPSGIPVGNIAANFGYLYPYGSMLENLCYPSDSATTAPYPFLDRWGDSWNVTAEMVILNQARSLGALSFLAAQTGLKTQPWRSVAGQINVPSSVRVNTQSTLTMQVSGIDLSRARITWEATGQEPSFGQSVIITPKTTGPVSVQAEAQMPDGRRIFARTTINVTN